LSCNEVLARHSEYLDGVLSGTEAERFRMHLAGCAGCARYDRVLREGVKLFAGQTAIQPDLDFRQTLHSRIADEEYRLAMRPVSPNATAFVSIAAVLALAAWIPSVLISREDESTALTAIAEAAASDFAATEIAWHGGNAIDDGARHIQWAPPDVSLKQTNADVSLIDRRYSPLILEAPTAPPTYSRVSLTAYDAR